MSEGEKIRKERDVEELKEILSVVSDKIPALIKGLISSVFSEDAAAGMGKAAATYYKELKAGGIPDDAALRMTQGYVETFTNLSEFLKSAAGERHGHRILDDEIKELIRKKMKEKLGEEE